MTLQRKLLYTYTGAIVILLIVVLASVSIILYFQREQLTIEETEKDARGLLTLLESDPANNSTADWNTVVESYQKHTHRNIALFDESGKLTASSFKEYKESTLPNDIKENISEALLYKTSRTFHTVSNGNYQSLLFVPQIQKDVVKGVVMIEYPHEEVVHLTIYRAILFGILVLVFGSIATALVYRYTRYRLVIPMNDLIANIGRIGTGESGFRIPISSNDEVGRIASSFNTLVSDMESTRNQLDKETKQLQIAKSELQKLEELKTVAKFSSSLISTSNVEDMMHLALKELCPLFQARGGAVVLIDFDTQTFLRRVNYGLSEDYIKLTTPSKNIQYKDSYVDEAFKNNKLWVIPNVYKDPRFGRWRDFAHKENYTGFICIPLMARNEKLGVMNLYFDREINPEEKTLNLLIVLADQLSMAILRAKVEEGIAIRAKQMTALHEFSQRIGSNLKLEYTLDIVLEEVTKLLGVDFGIIRLLNKDTQELTVSGTYGISDNEKNKLPILHVGLGVAGEIAKISKPIYVPDVNKDPRFRPYTPLEGEVSYLGVPLRVGEKVIGVLSCMTKNPRVFTEYEISYLSIMSSEAGIAIENARLYSETMELSMTDALTQLNNVRRLQSQMVDELARAERYGRFVSFVMIDIDHFKKYNDKHGHPRGDVVLQKVAQMMKQHVRDIDQVYRYGGEELCILLPETEKETAYSIAERIRQVVAEFPFIGEKTQPGGNLTISAGVATYPIDALTKEGLISHADEALYEAKALGRNRVCQYSEEKNKAK